MDRISPILIGFVLASATTVAQPEPERDPAAIEILERADRAIRQLDAVSFRSEYNGLFSARGRLVGDVTLRRGAGEHEVIGTTRYSARLDVTMIDSPWGHEAFPPDYVLIEHDDRAWLVDRAGGLVKVAEGFERLSLNAAANTLILPQYLRPEPLGIELEQSVGARYLGRASVDDTESDLVWLRFDEASGLGEQLLYFGVDDHLLRKVVLFSPRAELSEAESGAAVTNPNVGFELVLRGLRTHDPEKLHDDAFAVDVSGLRRIDLDAAEYDVGKPGPSWRARLPDGDWVSSRDLLGRVAVLVFWASWCPTCHGFLPEVQEIHDSYGNDVRVLAINTFDRDDAMGFIREHGYSFEVALDGDLALERFRFVGQPAVVVLDRSGVIRHRQLSAAPASTGNPQIWKAIDEALAGASEAAVADQ